MYFYNLIKDFKEEIMIFVDMDGVITDYNFGNKLDFKNKRPLTINIRTLKKISELKGVELYILSICKKILKLRKKYLVRSKCSIF